MKRNIIHHALRGMSAMLIPALPFVPFLFLLLVASPSFAAVTYRSAASAGVSSGGAITYVGVGAVAAANGGNVSPGYPSGWQAGDLLLCIVEQRDNVAASMPAGWTALSAANSGAQHRASIFWKFAATGDTTTPTITRAGGNAMIARIIGFRGVDTATPFDVANSFTVSGADLTTEAAAITTVSANAMLVFTAHMADNHTSIGTPAGSTPWTQAFFSASNVGNDASIAAYYGLRSAVGSQSAIAATRAGAANAISHGAQIALRPIGTSDLTINRPAGTVTADLMFASVAVTPSTVTITPPVGWTLVNTFTQASGGSSRTATYYRIAGFGEPASYSWTLTGPHTGAVGGILSFSGVDNSAPIDAHNGNVTASSLTHTAPSVTTTQPDGMLVTVHQLASAATWTFPTGMTEAVDVASQATNNAAGISMEMNYQARPTAGATGTRAAVASANADTGAVHSIALKATPLVCYTDDFNRANGSPGADWTVSSSSGSFGNPVIFNNRLRLTDATGNVATMATLQRLFPGAGNRIEVEFDHYAYGGSGADGIAVTLSDSSVTPAPGGYGGSLGYAQRTGPNVNGFAGGWLGIGIDEYGNFSNPTEGRVGGPGLRVDSVSVRGSGSGISGYAYHAGTAANLTPQVDNNGSASPPHRYRIIVDHSNTVNALVSVERDTGSGYAMLISPYDAKAQAGQAEVPIGWLLSYTGSTGGSTNIHEIDSLSICSTTQVPVSGINHFEITVAPSASTCASQNVTITAKDISNNTLTSYAGSITVTTSSSHGDWSVVSAGGSFSNGTADDGVATYTFVAGDNGVITLAFTNTHADDLLINVTDGTVPASSTNSATISFRDSAFVITPDPIQIVGRNQSMTAALYTRLGGSCTPDTNYTGNKNLDAWLTLDPLDPGGAVPTIGALTLPTVAPASNAASNNLSLTFTNGVASFTLATTDVGRYVLNLRDDTRLYANAVDLGGASTSITSRPWLHVAVPGNMGVSSAGGARFTSAGADFTATVRGVRWQAADDANNDGVPDAGANLANNTAAASYAWDTALAAVAPFTPATPLDTPAGSGLPGSLSRGSGASLFAQSSFASGSATAADWRYSEVGSFTLQATAMDYLGSGANLTSGGFVVGRFTPAYFNVAATHGCATGSFTYSGQPFALVSVTPYGATGGAINNYRTSLGFSKNVTISNAGDTNNFNSTNTLPATAFTGANGSSTTVAYTLPGKETAPVTLTLRAVDTDLISSAGHTEAENMLVRSGRVVLRNAVGSELVGQSMHARAQYYDTTTGWVINSADSCTSFPQLRLLNDVPTSPVQGAPPLIKNIGAAATTVTLGAGAFATGQLSINFTAPGVGGTGYVDVTVPSGVLPDYLKYDWDGDGAHDDDPVGRATFGIHKGSPRHIYRRERY